MRNMDDKDMIEKVKERTQVTRNKIKRTIENFQRGDIVRVSNHIQVIENTDYVMYKEQRGLKKGINKEKWMIKAKVFKNKTNHCKIQIVETYDSEAKLSVGTVWRIDKDAIKKSN